MKNCFFIFVIVFFVFSSCNTKQSAEVQTIHVDDQWKFSTGDDATWANPDFDDNGWATLSVRSHWENQGYEDHDGYGWYRKRVTIPAGSQDSIEKYGGIVIAYDSADDVDELFFNGHSIGTTGSFPPDYKGKLDAKRKYIVPAKHILYDSPNTIAVRVYDGGGGGGIVTQQFTVRTMTPLDGVTYTFTLSAKEWVFTDDEFPQMDIMLNNTYNDSLELKVICILTTDKHELVDSITGSRKLNPMGKELVEIPFALPAPGFYRCKIYMEKDGLTSDPQNFNIGYEPEKIISPSDAKEDFETFWQETLKELDRVNPDYKITLLPELSTGAKNIYKVEMMSFGNIKIEGYYATPKAKGVYPAIIAYMGYGADGYYPHTDASPGYAEFVLSVRGQGFLKPDNIYNSDWITYGLDSKENYYYRGAFMDLIRGVDFLVSRPEVDSKRILAEGSSQGGTFTLAACALDHRILAGAPTLPGFSDYRDYFEITPWPRSSFQYYLDQHPGDSWDRLYDLLTYFDVKNLAQWIKCPIVMGIGLQDETCPPHINFAAYNLIGSEKDYRIYRDQGHSTPLEWYLFRMEFFNKQTGK